MMRSLTTAGTGMIAQQANLDIISNNLANVNTTAFKGQRAEFQDLMYQTFKASGSGDTLKNPTAVQIGLGSKFVGNDSNFAPGPLQSTNNPTDLAIQGNGFFEIAMADGSTAYTRDGSFKIDSSGLLVTSEGYHLQPDITVPAGVTSLTIGPDGTVSGVLPGTSEPSTIGNITITTFPNPGGLTRIGGNLYQAGGNSGSPSTVTPGQEGSGTIQAGFLEGSNVQVVEEMVKMILAQRAYEINSKAIQTADDMLGVLNNLKR